MHAANGGDRHKCQEFAESGAQGEITLLGCGRVHQRRRETSPGTSKHPTSWRRHGTSPDLCSWCILVTLAIHWIPTRTTSHLSIYLYSSFHICQRCHHRVLIPPPIDIAIHSPCVIHPSLICPLRHCSCHTLVSDAPQPHTQQSLCLQDELPSMLSHLRRDLPSTHSDRFCMAPAYSFTHCSPFLAFMLY